MGDITTGLVEETAKLLVVLLIFKLIPIRYAFTGLLIGFAVGAGFDVFETSDYGMFELFDSNGDIYQMQGLLLVRTLFALGIGHHFWTGILAGTFNCLKQESDIQIQNPFTSNLYHRLYWGCLGTCDVEL